MIAAIVATDYNNAIGYKNDLLFRVPADLKRFRELTTGHTVIMGRKTYDSLPNKPLPNRTNIVITSKVNGIDYSNDDVIYSDLDTIKSVLERIVDGEPLFTENIFVIGGGTIYKELLLYCDRIYLTRVHMMYKNVDTFFPNIEDDEYWELTSQSDIHIHNGMNYQFLVYDRHYHAKRTVVEKKIFIINGGAGTGKDSFVEYVSDIVPTINFSSVDKVKEIAKMIGWHGGKTERDRKFLSDLKMLCSEYSDMPMNSMKEKVFEFHHGESVALFLHIREPDEIEIAKKIFNAETVLIKRDFVKHITSNMSDANVYNFEYDYVIDNNGTFDDLKNEARMFVNKVWGLNF